MIRFVFAVFLFLNLAIFSQEDPDVSKKNPNKILKQSKDKKKTKAKSTEKAKKNPSEVTEKRNNEYWISSEFLQNSNYIPGLETKQDTTQAVSNTLPEVKEVKKLTTSPTIPKKENVFYTFLNENKKIIFIVLAIIIFAVYRLRFSGGSGKTYNNRYRK
jgi:Holliday junction resolvasome RuvABC DNA-binding subunit